MTAADFKVELLDNLPSRGGQHVGVPNRCMRVTHLPSGVVITIPPEAQGGRSQHKAYFAAKDAIQFLLLEIG